MGSSRDARGRGLCALDPGIGRNGKSCPVESLYMSPTSDNLVDEILGEIPCRT